MIMGTCMLGLGNILEELVLLWEFCGLPELWRDYPSVAVSFFVFLLPLV